MKTNMPSNMSKVAILLASFASFFSSTLAVDLIETCEDLQGAVDALQDGDVTVYMHPFAEIVCETYTTFSITQNHLSVLADGNMENFHGYSELLRGRFEVSGTAELTWETNLQIEGFEEYQDTNGGGIQIHEGGRARFLNDLTMEDVGVRSVPVGDWASYQLQGGCVWTAGYLRVEGLAVFNACENVGGGESSPGEGGAIYVEDSGFVVFNGGVQIRDASILDDEGNSGGGIFNRGTVNIRGQSKFERLFAETAGAIFNAEDALFRFKAGATAIFSECKSFDAAAGAIHNAGYMKFTGAALFLDGKSSSSGGAIIVTSSGKMILSENSVFFQIETGDGIGAPVYVYRGGELDVPETLLFIDTTDEDDVCGGIYFQEGEICKT